jgi:hypothetical protein
MLRNLLFHRPAFVLTFSAAVLILLPACSVNVKKGESGDDKKVDIETPVGGIHVSKDADARDTGLPVYPGARPKEKRDNDHDETSANVNMSWGAYGLRVIAVQYTTDDSPEKVAAFYRDKLKTYGTILECHTDKNDVGNVDTQIGDKSDKNSQELSCGKNTGKDLELKVGTKENQHLVNIRPQDSGKGTDFALVYVRLHNEKDTI